MFWFIKKVLIVLLSYSKSLSTKHVSLNNEPCMTLRWNFCETKEKNVKAFNMTTRIYEAKPW